MATSGDDKDNKIVFGLGAGKILGIQDMRDDTRFLIHETGPGRGWFTVEKVLSTTPAPEEHDPNAFLVNIVGYIGTKKKLCNISDVHIKPSIGRGLIDRGKIISITET